MITVRTSVPESGKERLFSEQQFWRDSVKFLPRFPPWASSLTLFLKDLLPNTRHNRLACLKYVGQPVNVGKKSTKSAGPCSFSVHQPKKCIPISRETAPWYSAVFQLLSCPLAQKKNYWLLSVYMLLSLELKQSRKNKFLLTEKKMFLLISFSQLQKSAAFVRSSILSFLLTVNVTALCTCSMKKGMPPDAASFWRTRFCSEQ